MGLVRAEITLRNTGDVSNARRGIIKDSEIRQMTLTALVDTGAFTLVINEAVRKELGLEITGRKHWAELADGTGQIYQLTEPVDIHWKDRDSSCKAVLLPESREVLMGAIPLEDMDLMVHPSKEELVGVHGDQAIYRI